MGMARKQNFNIERFFQALGDNTRLRLLNLMGEQEICVCYFVDILGSPQPKISRHLAYLRSAGIVSARREGKWMHYHIVMPPHIGATQILRQTLEWLKEDGQCKPTERACRKPAAPRRSLRHSKVRQFQSRSANHPARPASHVHECDPCKHQLRPSRPQKTVVS